jgi:DNA-binding transcriptional MerR regulator
VSTYRISQLAERTGVPATTLRFYETAGLLPAERTAAGHRVYDEGAVERLAFIGTSKHLGLPLEEVAELLAVWESGTCADVRADLRPRIAARRGDAERRIAELEEFASSLRRALERLDALPERTGRCDAECGVVDPAPRAHPAVAEPSPRPGGAVSRPGRDDGARWRTAPVACSLTTDGRDERVDQWRRLLQGAGHEQIPGGCRLALPIERAAAVAALATAEQRCCPFLDFRIHLDGSLLYLEVRAPADGTGLLAELFAPAG